MYILIYFKKKAGVLETGDENFQSAISPRIWSMRHCGQQEDLKIHVSIYPPNGFALILIGEQEYHSYITPRPVSP